MPCESRSAGQPARGQELMGPATVSEAPRLVAAVLDRKDPWDVLEQMRHQPTIARGSPHPGRDSRDADFSTIGNRDAFDPGRQPDAARWLSKSNFAGKIGLGDFESAPKCLATIADCGVSGFF
jgi:hypothetical protein